MDSNKYFIWSNKHHVRPKITFDWTIWVLVGESRLMQVNEDNLADLKGDHEDHADHCHKIGRVVVKEDTRVKLLIKTVYDVGLSVVISYCERENPTDAERGIKRNPHSVSKSTEVQRALIVVFGISVFPKKVEKRVIFMSPCYQQIFQRERKKGLRYSKE